MTNQGVILNNSRTNVQTQLGGYVQGNPYLATGSARVILNEVNSSNPSYLNGYIEVAGSRAQVVIANPAGISCNGCGFINTSRATLTTGTPLFGAGINGGDLMAYRVGGGVIDFLGAGLDSANANYTDVLARAVNVNASLFAQNLNIVTGSNQINVASAQNNGDTYITAITPIAPNATLPDGSANPIPAFAVDVAALGGMYAGKIHLIGTEAGVGVRNAGSIGASAGEVVIDINGNLINTHPNNGNANNSNSNSNPGSAATIASSGDIRINADHITNTGGSITAVQQLDINANSLTGDGKILAGGDATVTLTSDYTHTATQTGSQAGVQSGGELQADGNLTLTTTGNINNQAKLLASNTLTLNAANINNATTGEIAGLNTHLNTTQGGLGRLGTGSLTNRGLIDGSDTFINAGTVDNIGTGSLFGDHVAIAANTLNNTDETIVNPATGVSSTSAAVIAARSRLDLGISNTINNLNNSLIFSAGDLHIGGAMDANHQATVTASQVPAQGQGQAQTQTATLINQGATIEALGNLSANIADLQNQNSGISTQSVFVSSAAYDQFTPRGQSVVWNAADYPAAQIGNQNISWRTAGPYTFREYYRYVYTGSTSETQLLSSAPAQLLSGGNMTLLGNITNSDSKVIAGGALDISAASVNNVNTQGQTTTSYSGTRYFYDYDGSGSGFDYDVSASAYHPASQVTTFNLATTQTLANTSPASMGAASNTTIATLNNNTLNNTLPTNSLFTPTANPSAGYIIETNPRFANYRTWLSSDTMLKALSYDPATQTKRLGDGFYEQRLIREQINHLTGQRFLSGYSNEEAQYQALMLAGVTFAQQYQLIPGVALSASQVAQLTSDIVWLVTEEVALPAQYDANGKLIKAATTTTALVPQVYVRLQPGDLQNTGALLAGNSVTLNLTSDAINSGNLLNSGTIGSRTLLAINANNIDNLGGMISGKQVQLNADNDINNLGGIITAQNSLTLNADNDINVQSTTQSSHNSMGKSTFTRTNLDRIAGLYVTNPDGAGLLLANAGNDLNLNAAEIRNSGGSPLSLGERAEGESKTLLKAGNNLSLGTVQIAEQNNSIRNSKNYIKHGSTQEIGTAIQTQGDIALMAGHDLKLRAADISIAPLPQAGAGVSMGTLTGVAGNDITIEAGEATSNMSAARTKKKSGTFSSKKTTTRDTFNDTTSIASSLSADQINLIAGAALPVIPAQAGIQANSLNAGNLTPSTAPLSQYGAKGYRGTGDLTVTGSQVVATHDVNLNATGDIHIQSATDTHSETHYKKIKQSGLSSSGASVSYGKSSLKTTNNTQTTTHVASTVGSVEGDVNINAGKDVKVTASELIAGQDLNIQGQNVTLDAAYDTYANQQTMKYQQSGISVGLSSPAISAVQSAAQSAERSTEVEDGRLQALYALKTAKTIYDNMDSIEQAVQDPTSAIGINISIGSSKASSKSTVKQTNAVGDTLTAGRDINITATGSSLSPGERAEGEGDISMTGASVTAGRDVVLTANNDITLQSALNTSEQSSKSKSSSASIGVSISPTGGITPTASIGSAKGKTNGNSLTHTETIIHAGDTLMTDSGRNTTLKGAIVSGETVLMDVGTHSTSTYAQGGNLRLGSEQDSANYKSKNSSFNAGLSANPNAGANLGADNTIGGTISLGNGKVASTYNSVIEQTAIQAGNGGFNINVAGNTHLQGAVIDSTNNAVQSSVISPLSSAGNSLTTQTLTVADIQNKAQYNASQSTVGYNFNGTSQTDTDDPAGGSAGNMLGKGLSGIAVATSGEASGTTRSAIANADITITGNNTHDTTNNNTLPSPALTPDPSPSGRGELDHGAEGEGGNGRGGNNNAEGVTHITQDTLALLNRDTQHANGSISNPYNPQKVQEQLEFLQVAGEVIILPVAAKAAKWIGDQFPPDPKDPAKIDPAKVLAHAALAAAVSQLLGTGWQTGAAAGVLGDVLPQVLAKAFEKDENGKIKDEQAFKAANAIISAVLASATGADLAQTINAGMVTQNAVENNWLKHQEKLDLAKYKQACSAGSQEACGNAIKLELLDKLRNRDLLNACVNLSPEACATQLNLDPAAKAYFVENFYTIGFGRVIGQFGEHANQAAAPQQLTDITISLIPVVGDVTGFAEAESPFDYTLALIGALGPAGDVAKALVKEAKILAEAGDTVKAAEKLDAAQIVVANAAKGKVFEDGVLAALNLPKNTVRIPVTLPGGKAITVIPDALGKTIIEAKDVKYLSMSDQFRGYLVESLANNKPIQLYVSPDTKISKPLYDKIINNRAGGSIQVFDPITKALTEWKPK